ncbi:hypothetical protein [Kaarinaea lacus]
MGLFQKTRSEDKSKDELPKYVDSLLEDSHKTTNEEIDERFSVATMSLNNNYGIDHVVALMRDLPNDNSEVVVAVVTKTLESANINISNIITDAAKKEQMLESEIHQLKDEIKTLQAQIAEKEEKISVSTAILEETKKVKGLLEDSDLDDEKQPAKIDSSEKEELADTKMQLTSKRTAEA